jgi:hypothetical protein
MAGGPLRAGGRARRHQRPHQPARRRGRHRPGAIAAPAARGGGGLADDHRADPASVDLRHIGSPSAQGLASPRPPHRRRRSAARRDGGQLAGHRGRSNETADRAGRAVAAERRREIITSKQSDHVDAVNTFGVPAGRVTLFRVVSRRHFWCFRRSRRFIALGSIPGSCTTEGPQRCGPFVRPRREA